MAGLGKTHFNAIHRALRNRSASVDFSATWRDIHREFGLGRIERGKLHLSRADLEQLRTDARQTFGWDPMEPLSGQTRLQAANQAIDEKLAAGRPDDAFVLVKGNLPAPLPQLDPELSLRVPLGRLDAAGIAQVLVVENLDSFDDWQAYPRPAALDGCLVLYRGHGGLARGARRLLASLLPGTPVTVFADYDPAGLLIAAGLRATHLLLPELEAHLLAKGNREHFVHQYTARRHLENTALHGWQTVWEEMRGHGVSLKQQHMLALGARLRRVPRHA